jgi:CDGSH-type Zn-finger protein
MSQSEPPVTQVILPEVRQVQPGDCLQLCNCGRSTTLPDCDAGCSGALRLDITRAQSLLLCCCARSARLPYCDGSHQPEAVGIRAKWRRFIGAD